MTKPKVVVKPKTAPQKTAIKKQIKTPPKKTPVMTEELVYAPNLRCSFCGKLAKNARRLIALDPPSTTCICDKCIEVCLKILLEESPLEWISRITRIFALKTEQIKSLPKQAEKKQRSKKRL
jgi:hypothetical protein